MVKRLMVDKVTKVDLFHQRLEEAGERDLIPIAERIQQGGEVLFTVLNLAAEAAQSLGKTADGCQSFYGQHS